MATRFWVGGSGTWDTSSTTHWSATDGGASGASNPTASDDVIINGNSGSPTIAIDTVTSPVCRSLNTTGATCTINWQSSASSHLKIGDGSGGALTFSATTTVSGTPSTTDALQFVSTSNNGGAGWPITTSGILMPCMTFNGVGGGWQLQDNLTWTSGGTGAVTLTNGALDLNGKTLTGWSFVTNNSNVRTLTMGAANINLSATGSAWSITHTNLTFNAGTSTITITGSGALLNISGTGVTYYNAVLSGPGNQRISIQTGGNISFNNVTRTGTALKTDGFLLDSTDTYNIAGTLTLNSNSSTNRLLVLTSTVGSAVTVNAAALVCSGVIDFQDIHAGGVATWTTAASGATYFGDCGGNTGITFTPAATQTATGTSSFTWSTHGWTSRVPLPQDDVIINNAFSASQTVTADMPRLGKSIDFTGVTGGLIWFLDPSNTAIFGSLTLTAGVSALNGNHTLTFSGRGSHTITHAGLVWSGSFLAFSGPGGTYSLQDDIQNSSGNGQMSVTDGTLTTNNHTITTAVFVANSGRTIVINAGTSTFNISNLTGSPWQLNSSATTWNGSSSTIVFTTTSTSTRTFASGAKTYGTLTYTVANSPGSLTITAAGVFNTLNVASGRVLTMPSATTNTVTNFNVNGAPNAYLYLPGAAANYISTPDSTALSVTGDIDIRVRAALDDWTPASGPDLISKWGSSPQQGWDFNVVNNGKLRFYISSTGSNQSSVDSSAATGFTDGSIQWVRATWRASDGRVQFFTASGAITNPIASDFTQLGTDQTMAVGSIFDNTAAVEVGSERSGNVQAQGKFYRAQIRNGLDGTLVYDADFTAKPFGANSFTESSAQAATVTLNGSLMQAGDGRVLINSSTPGTAASLAKATDVVLCDYLSIQDSTAGGGAAWYAGPHSVNISGNSGWIFTGLSRDNRFFGMFD